MVVFNPGYFCVRSVTQLITNYVKVIVSKPKIRCERFCHQKYTGEKAMSLNVHTLKLTCHHINRRHFCFNIKSISVHPLLWMNVMLDFICMVFFGM